MGYNIYMSKDIPNFLLSKPSRRFNPYSNWRTYKDREIVVFIDKNIDFWDTHPDGIIIESEGQVFINGTDLAYERERERTIRCATAIQWDL